MADYFEELPKLKGKQQQFVLRYSINGNNGAEAYRYAYDCQNSSEATINVEVSRLLKNPKIALWLKHITKNIQQVFEDEIKYSAKDCFDELSELQSRCKRSSKTYNVEKGCIELKGKLAGHFVDRHQVTGGNLAEVLEQLK